MVHPTLLVLIVVALSLVGSSPPARGGEHKETVTVYRSKTCGCCGKWVQHLKQAGFEAADHVLDTVENAPGRDRVPKELRSCHTARVGRYLVEGHVPADVIRTLLKQEPELVGLAVPGMPAGSPGMESPTPVPYDIIGWDSSGKQSVFAKR